MLKQNTKPFSPQFVLKTPLVFFVCKCDGQHIVHSVGTTPVYYCVQWALLVSIDLLFECKLLIRRWTIANATSGGSWVLYYPAPTGITFVSIHLHGASICSGCGHSFHCPVQSDSISSETTFLGEMISYDHRSIDGLEIAVSLNTWVDFWWHNSVNMGELEQADRVKWGYSLYNQFLISFKPDGSTLVLDVIATVQK